MPGATVEATLLWVEVWALLKAGSLCGDPPVQGGSLKTGVGGVAQEDSQGRGLRRGQGVRVLLAGTGHWGPRKCLGGVVGW